MSHDMFEDMPLAELDKRCELTRYILLFHLAQHDEMWAYDMYILMHIAECESCRAFYETWTGYYKQDQDDS